MGAVQLSSLPPHTVSGAPTEIDRLVSEIWRLQSVLDRRLSRPARWRGRIRKEFRRRRAVDDQRSLLAAAFDEMALSWDARRQERFDVSHLLQINGLLGGDAELRTVGVRVGGFKDAAHHHDLPKLVATALDRAQDGVEDPVLAAARLHVELLLIHPFRDGNGRTVRLATTWLLMKSGMRSTLLTAVEQHCRVEHQQYVDAFDTLRLSEPTDHDAWLVTNLEMMAANARSAVWFREREERLRSLLDGGGVPRRRHDSILLDFDLGRSGTGSPIVGLSPDEVGLRDLVESMSAADRTTLTYQVSRLLDEEADN